VEGLGAAFADEAAHENAPDEHADRRGHA
jgi:hypothetical protein